MAGTGFQEKHRQANDPIRAEATVRLDAQVFCRGETVQARGERLRNA